MRPRPLSPGGYPIYLYLPDIPTAWIMAKNVFATMESTIHHTDVDTDVNTDVNTDATHDVSFRSKIVARKMFYQVAERSTTILKV